MRVATRGAIASALVVAAIAVPSAPPSAARGAADGRFKVVCFFVEHDQVDPIVSPGVRPSAHLHTFVGVPVDETTTAHDLSKQTTNCDEAGDRSGYWIPTLLDEQGDPVDPANLGAYYSAAVGNDPVEPIPFGLAVVSDRFAFHCGPGSPREAEPYDCGPYGGTLKLAVTFPSCWDGRRLDSADHRSHMAYKERTCPSSHPVEVVQLTEQFNYPVVDATGYRLSSGDWSTMHADFLNAWKRRRLAELVEDCVNAGVDCR